MKRLLTLALSLLVMSGCAVNPVTGKNELSFISEREEIARGAAQYLPSQQSQGGVLTVDPELTAYVSEVGQRVAAAGDRDLPYEFVVLNNGVPNAWALPGGKIAINRGLLLELDNEAELAAVLGHEAVHAAAKHGINAMQRGMILQGVVTATAIGVSASDTDYGNYIIGGAQIGAQLINQKYGRGAELESDLYGTRYMAKAGYDPAAAISLQETFVRLSDGRSSSFIQGLFASHPPSVDRVAANRRTVTELGDPGGELGRERYQQAIAFITENSYAYENFEEAQSFAGKKQYNEALRSLDAAITQLPQEPRFHGLRGNVYYQQRQYDKAQAAFARALDLDENYFEYHLGQGLVYSRKGNRTLARQYLERSNQLLPTAVASNELGELSLVAGNRALAKQYFSAAMNVQGDLGKKASNSFVRLDLEDNPTRYFEVQSGVTDAGLLVARVANRTSFDAKRVNLTFSATYAGSNRTVTVPVAVKAGAVRDVSSGIKFPSLEGLDYQVQVTGAEL